MNDWMKIDYAIFSVTSIIIDGMAGIVLQKFVLCYNVV